MATLASIVRNLINPPAPTVPPTVPSTHAEELEQFRQHAQQLRASADRANQKIDAVTAEMSDHQAVIGNAASVRAELVNASASRAAGEQITDAQIREIEKRLVAAEAAARNASAAHDGCMAVASALQAERVAIHGALVASVERAKPVIAHELRNRLQASILQHEQDAQEFAQHHAAHHGEVRAITTFARDLGLGDLSTYPNGSASELRVPATATHARPNTNLVIFAGNGIEAERARVAAELQSLLP